MPKKKDKRLTSDPFERFLPQIDDSRKKKDDDINNVADVDENDDKAVNDNVSKNINNDVNVSNDDDKIVNNDVNSIKNNYDAVVDDVAVNISINSVNAADNDVDNNADVDKIVYGSTDSDIDVAVDSDVAVNVAGTFRIQKKTPKSAHYTRATFYLRPDQVRTINRLHKDSGRDKSELVRMALDSMIKRAKVE